MTTIHGFCNRLLAGHPVAAGIDPGFRVLDAPEAARAAREAFDDALAEFLAGGEAESREETGRRPIDIDGLRAIVAGVHAELRSRGEAEPRLPEPPPRDPVDGDRARRSKRPRQALEELKRERPQTRAGRAGAGAAERARAAAGPRRAARRCAPTARRRRSLPYREAIDAAISRTRRGRRGRRRLPPPGRRCWSSSRPASRRPRNAAPGSTSRTCRSSPRGCSSGPRSARPTAARFSHLLVDEFQDTNRLQLRLIEALRGPAQRAGRGRRRVAVDLRLPPRRPRRLPPPARAGRRSAPTPS